MKRFHCKRKGDDIFKLTIWNEGLHDSNDNGVVALNFDVSKKSNCQRVKCSYIKHS